MVCVIALGAGKSYLQRSPIEGIAGLEITGLQPGGEPANPLLRTAVGE
jgi:hypothetical protein